MRSIQQTLALPLLAAIVLPSSAGPVLPNTPAVTREFSVFVGNRRVDAGSRESTYFEGVFYSNHTSRENTVFGGMKRNDAWDRETSVERSNAFCAPDLNSDAQIDFFDVTIFLGWFTTMDLRADWNGDGILNFFDTVDFIAAFGAACP